jgi:carboxyl-terminal processing protease
MVRGIKGELAVVFLVCGSLGCGASAPTSSTATTTDSCSVLGEVQFVRSTLQDIYFWYKELPDPAPAGFTSPEAYLDAVRYKAVDKTFSFVESKAASDAFYSDSQFIGIGISTHQASATELRIAQVFPGGPAADANLERGDYLLTINSKAVPDLLSSGDIDTIFGPNTAGVVVTLTWRSFLSGEERSASLAKRPVTIPTVSLTSVYNLRRGPRVGYVFFRNFVQPSTAALNAAFAELTAAGVDDLVLDLRYNGGGLVSVAQHLGSLIGGAGTTGRVFVEFFHNDKNASRNSTLTFDDPVSALGLSRLVVIATEGTASASESVINGLRPFIPVTVVGDRTYGKPVGQYGYDFCDKTLYPVAFEVRNARGEGSYFDGIPANCPAADDLDHPLGDEGEASLAEALNYLQTGSCSTTAAVAALSQARREAQIGRPVHGGFQQLLNAY